MPTAIYLPRLVYIHFITTKNHTLTLEQEKTMTAITQSPTSNAVGIKTILWSLIVAGFTFALVLGQIGFYAPPPGVLDYRPLFLRFV